MTSSASSPPAPVYHKAISQGSLVYTTVLEHIQKCMGPTWNSRLGLPVLSPNYLIPEEVHLLGGGVDRRTNCGGFTFSVLRVPPPSQERCVLCSTTIVDDARIQRVSVLLYASMHMYRVAVRLPRTWFDGTSVLDVFYDHIGRRIRVADIVVFRGQHVMESGFGTRHRIAWLQSPAGFGRRYVDSVAIEREEERKVAVADRAALRAARLVRSSTADSLWSLEKKALDSTLLVRTHSLELDIQLLQWTTYPDFPDAERAGADSAESAGQSWWIRAHSDYATSELAYGCLRPGYFYEVPDDPRDFLYYFYASVDTSSSYRTARRSRMRLKLHTPAPQITKRNAKGEWDEGPDAKEWVEDTATGSDLAWHCECAAEEASRLRKQPGERIVVACIYNQDRDQFEFVSSVSDRVTADTLAVHEQTRRAQHHGVAIAYLNRLHNGIEAVQRTLKMCSTDLRRSPTPTERTRLFLINW